jgi:hypothetical protein
MTGGVTLHTPAACRTEAVASGRLTLGTLAGLDRSLWRDLVLRLSPIGPIGLNPPRSSLTSGKEKICGDNAIEPLWAPTVCRKQRDFKRFCGFAGSKGQNICIVEN